MKIFNAEQIRHWDEATLKEQGLTTAQLMKRAGARCAQWIISHYPAPLDVLILCGKGGNGGDGLVIAAGLLQAQYTVNILLIEDPEQPGGLSAAAYEQWNELKKLAPAGTNIFLDSDIANMPGGMKKAASDDYSTRLKIGFLKSGAIERLAASPGVLVVDALFGTGLSRGLTGDLARVIRMVNAMAGPRIAIDLPSGLGADVLPQMNTGDADVHRSAGQPDLQNQGQVIFKADECLSFQAFKRVFMHPEAAVFAGKVHLLDIGLSADFTRKTDTRLFATDAALAATLLRPRDPFGHKGSFGTAVLVGGSYGKIGAIGLSALAALRAGAGKVFIQAPACGYNILQAYVPEAMFQPAGDSCVATITPVEKAVFGIGPGFDQHPESREALQQFLSSYNGIALLDADALNLVAASPKELLPLLKPDSILTPHPKEFERLFGSSTDSMSRVQLAIEKAVIYQVVIVLKGHHTAVCLPSGECYYNTSGNAGMGTAGSGDVLTGIITGLLAQGYSAKDAAILGVYLHGLAGDLCVEQGAEQSLIARDIIENLAGAFRHLLTIQDCTAD